MTKERTKQIKYDSLEQRAMEKIMTPEEAYDKGYYQMAFILDRDRRIREALGMPSLYTAVRTKSKGRGRPKNDR